MSLNNEQAAEQFQSIRSMYQQKTDTLGALVYGDWGCGKTTLLGTAPKPVLIDSFDPGGTKVLRDQIEKGEVMVRAYEKEDSDAPTQYVKWEQQFSKDLNSGIFNHIGTYCVDSLTLIIQAGLNYLAKKSNLPDNIPGPREYQILGKQLGNLAKVMSDQPCHFIMTAHLEIEKDELLGSILAQIRGFKSVKADLPILFDEKWFLEPVHKPNGSEYFIHTKTRGIYKASTRLGSKGRFDAKEPADIAALIRKAGLNADDKPLLIGEKVG